MRFWRRNIHGSFEESHDWFIYQIKVLQAFNHWLGLKIHNVKPQGSFYNMASEGEFVTIDGIEIELNRNKI
jgi:lactam utilization protein B